MVTVPWVVYTCPNSLKCVHLICVILVILHKIPKNGKLMLSFMLSLFTWNYCRLLTYGGAWLKH
jgi:hypothetical protein